MLRCRRTRKLMHAWYAHVALEKITFAALVRRSLKDVTGVSPMLSSTAILVALLLGGVILPAAAARRAPPPIFGFEATDITAHSAVIHWIIPPGTKAIDFKISCDAVRQYSTPYGRLETEREKVVHYVPDSVDHILIGELKPNFKYSCIIVGEKWKSDSNSLECLLHFSTLYGAAEVPSTPYVEETERVFAYDDNGGQHEGRDDTQKALYNIHLYPVISKEAPLIRYEVYFMVEGWEERNDMISTLEEAQKSYQPISFKLPFSKDSLPNRLMVSSELFGHALKEEATYAVMTTIVAKENSPVSSPKMEFVSSKPSSFFTIPLSEKSARVHNVRKRTASILGGVSLVILVVVCLGGYVGHKKFREHDQAREQYNWKSAIMRQVLQSTSPDKSAAKEPYGLYSDISDIETVLESTPCKLNMPRDSTPHDREEADVDTQQEIGQVVSCTFEPAIFMLPPLPPFPTVCEPTSHPRPYLAEQVALRMDDGLACSAFAAEIRSCAIDIDMDTPGPSLHMPNVQDPWDCIIDFDAVGIIVEQDFQLLTYENSLAPLVDDSKDEAIHENGVGSKPLSLPWEATGVQAALETNNGSKPFYLSEQAMDEQAVQTTTGSKPPDISLPEQALNEQAAWEATITGYNPLFLPEHAKDEKAVVETTTGSKPIFLPEQAMDMQAVRVTMGSRPLCLLEQFMDEQAAQTTTGAKPLYLSEHAMDDRAVQVSKPLCLPEQAVEQAAQVTTGSKLSMLAMDDQQATTTGGKPLLLTEQAVDDQVTQGAVTGSKPQAAQMATTGSKLLVLSLPGQAMQSALGITTGRKPRSLPKQATARKSEVVISESENGYYLGDNDFLFRLSCSQIHGGIQQIIASRLSDAVLCCTEVRNKETNEITDSPIEESQEYNEPASPWKLCFATELSSESLTSERSNTPLCFGPNPIENEKVENGKVWEKEAVFKTSEEKHEEVETNKVMGRPIEELQDYDEPGSPWKMCFATELSSESLTSNMSLCFGPIPIEEENEVEDRENWEEEEVFEIGEKKHEEVEEEDKWEEETIFDTWEKNREEVEEGEEWKEEEEAIVETRENKHEEVEDPELKIPAPRSNIFGGTLSTEDFKNIVMHYHHCKLPDSFECDDSGEEWSDTESEPSCSFLTLGMHSLESTCSMDEATDLISWPQTPSEGKKTVSFSTTTGRKPLLLTEQAVNDQVTQGAVTGSMPQAAQMATTGSKFLVLSLPEQSMQSTLGVTTGRKPRSVPKQATARKSEVVISESEKGYYLGDNDFLFRLSCSQIHGGIQQIIASRLSDVVLRCTEARNKETNEITDGPIEESQEYNEPASPWKLCFDTELSSESLTSERSNTSLCFGPNPIEEENEVEDGEHWEEEEVFESGEEKYAEVEEGDEWEEEAVFDMWEKNREEGEERKEEEAIVETRENKHEEVEDPELKIPALTRSNIFGGTLRTEDFKSIVMHYHHCKWPDSFECEESGEEWSDTVPEPSCSFLTLGMHSLESTSSMDEATDSMSWLQTPLEENKPISFSEANVCSSPKSEVLTSELRSMPGDTTQLLDEVSLSLLDVTTRVSVEKLKEANEKEGVEKQKEEEETEAEMLQVRINDLLRSDIFADSASASEFINIVIHYYHCKFGSIVRHTWPSCTDLEQKSDMWSNASEDLVLSSSVLGLYPSDPNSIPGSSVCTESSDCLESNEMELHVPPLQKISSTTETESGSPSLDFRLVSASSKSHGHSCPVQVMSWPKFPQYVFIADDSSEDTRSYLPSFTEQLENTSDGARFDVLEKENEVEDGENCEVFETGEKKHEGDKCEEEAVFNMWEKNREEVEEGEEWKEEEEAIVETRENKHEEVEDPELKIPALPRSNIFGGTLSTKDFKSIVMHYHHCKWPDSFECEESDEEWSDTEPEPSCSFLALGTHPLESTSSMDDATDLMSWPSKSYGHSRLVQVTSWPKFPQYVFIADDSSDTHGHLPSFTEQLENTSNGASFDNEDVLLCERHPNMASPSRVLSRDAISVEYDTLGRRSSELIDIDDIVADEFWRLAIEEYETYGDMDDDLQLRPSSPSSSVQKCTN